MAPLTRLERATCGLGIRCSIHLSYRGSLNKINNLCKVEIAMIGAFSTNFPLNFLHS